MYLCGRGARGCIIDPLEDDYFGPTRPAIKLISSKHYHRKSDYRLPKRVPRKTNFPKPAALIPVLTLFLLYSSGIDSRSIYTRPLPHHPSRSGIYTSHRACFVRT